MNIPLRHYYALLAIYLRPQLPSVVLLALLLFSSIGLQLLNPQLLRSFIDAAVAGAPARTLTSTALLFLAVGLVNQIISAVATYVSNDVGWRATNRLRIDLVRHCVSLDLPFHAQHSPGELIERIDGDVTTLSTFFSQLVLRVLGSAALLIGVLVLLFREDWRAGLIVAAFVLLTLTVLNRIRNVAVAPTKAERQASAALFGFLEERLSGVDELRSSGAGGYVLSRLYQHMRAVFHTGRRARMIGGGLWTITMSLFVLGYVLALGIGGYLFTIGAITIGTVYLFFQYVEMLQSPLEKLTQNIEELQRATASIVRIRELQQMPRTIIDRPVATLPQGPLPVEFRDVSFGYDPEAPVLRHISFTLQPGKVLGVLGRTGSGKTTATRLLFRLYEAGGGSIRVGDVELRDVSLADLRGRIGLVTQDVQLFRGTIRDNLTFFDRSIADERIAQVFAELGLWSWYQALPAGLDTLLRPGGEGLSAGEAQLLAFARVFLKNPGLVILDEPSSRLDPATEQLIERAVSRLLRDRTCIIVAHRLSTIQRADEILILEDGHVREHGPRGRLVSDPTSQLYRLLRTGLERQLV